LYPSSSGEEFQQEQPKHYSGDGARKELNIGTLLGAEEILVYTRLNENGALKKKHKG
jgi:hypothetical protein